MRVGGAGAVRYEELLSSKCTPPPDYDKDGHLFLSSFQDGTTRTISRINGHKARSRGRTCTKVGSLENTSMHHDGEDDDDDDGQLSMCTYVLLVFSPQL
jgi:hypothetical protein